MFINSYHKYDGGNAIPYDTHEIIDKDIIIEDNVWIGDRVIILCGVTIGEGAIIQAGAVVVSDIPKFAIAGGNPARVFKYRDVEHYKKLKRKKILLVEFLLLTINVKVLFFFTFLRMLHVKI